MLKTLQEEKSGTIKEQDRLGNAIMDVTELIQYMRLIPVFTRKKTALKQFHIHYRTVKQYNRANNSH